jgi:hypothetical protein
MVYALISPSTDLLLLVLAVSFVVLSAAFAGIWCLNKEADKSGM